MADIRPNVLPAAILPLRSGDALIVDQGSDGVRQTDPFSMTDSVAPVASQAEAVAGLDNTKRMTALRTKQSIASEVGVSLASSTQGAKADSAVQSVNGKTGNSVTLVKGDVGLGNVDNTSDANKPVSTAQQSALDLKANTVQAVPPGGTTGQVLSKTSNADNSVGWSDAGAGDMLKAVYDPTNASKNSFDGFPVASRADMKLLDTSQFTSVFLTETGRQGSFFLADYSSFSSLVTSDVNEGLFVRSTFDNSKVFVRNYKGPAVDTWFGVVRYPTASPQPSAVDSVSAFNAGLEACRVAGVRFGMSVGDAYVSNVTSSYAILTKGTSIEGLGSRYTESAIRPLTTMASTASFILFDPPASSDLGGISFRNFMILPFNSGFSGTKYGKYAFWLNSNKQTNISNFVMEDVYFAPGNDYSLRLENNGFVNFQGVPANSTFNRCQFWEGTNITFVGDSIRFRDCVLRSSVGSGRTGVQSYQVDTTGGVASSLVLDNVNSDCDGGTLLMLRGRNPRIINGCNIEQSHGNGTPNGAVIDFDGSSGTIVNPIAEGCAIGIFTAPGNPTTTAQTAIRFNNVVGGYERGNTIITDVARAQAVGITSNAESVSVEIGNADPKWTTWVNDLGIGTRGVIKTLSLINGYANIGSGFAPASYFKSSDGTVTLKGLLSTPTNPNGVILGTLPSAYRPVEAQRFPAYGLVSSSNQSVWVQILSNGEISLLCPSETSQVDLSGISFATNPKVSSSL